MRDIKRIILHCSDSPDENDKVDAKMIKTWHKERGWKDIGYHYKTCPNLNIHWVRAMMLSTYHLLIGKHKHHLMLLEGGEREDVDNQLDT